MATRDLSPVEARALWALVKYVRVTSAVLGAVLWNLNGTNRRGGQSSCPFARPAGSVVKRLVALGFARRVFVEKDPRTLYEATKAGEENLRNCHATRVAAGLSPPPRLRQHEGRLNAENAQLRSQVERLEAENYKIAKNCNRLNDERNEAQAQVERLTAELAAANNERNKWRTAAGELSELRYCTREAGSLATLHADGPDVGYWTLELRHLTTMGKDKLRALLHLSPDAKGG